CSGSFNDRSEQFVQQIIVSLHSAVSLIQHVLSHGKKAIQSWRFMELHIKGLHVKSEQEIYRFSRNLESVKRPARSQAAKFHRKKTGIPWVLPAPDPRKKELLYSSWVGTFPPRAVTAGCFS